MGELYTRIACGSVDAKSLALTWTTARTFLLFTFRVLVAMTRELASRLRDLSSTSVVHTTPAPSSQ